MRTTSASQAAQAGGEEDDEGEAPIVKEPTDEMSRVNAATLQLFKDTCKSLAKGLMDAYETWQNRVVRAPDPFKCVPFSKTAWECLDIDFFDVSFLRSLMGRASRASTAVTSMPRTFDFGTHNGASHGLSKAQNARPASQAATTCAGRASASTVRYKASCRWSSNSSASGTRRRPT
jgi:hypothetical protein